MSSANVNANFALALLTDTSRTCTVTHTYTATQTFTGGWSAGAACSISTGGIAVTGNSTITGTLGGITTLTATTVVASLTGNATSATTAGTVTTPAQPAITSLGTLTSVTVNGGAIIAGDLTMTAATSRILPGVTAWTLRNNGDTADNLIITNAGAATHRAGVTVTTGNVTVTAGNLTFGAASAKIIPGATSLLFRNNGDSADNLSITDAGVVSVRASLTVPTADIGVGHFKTGTTTGVTAVGATTIYTAVAAAGVVIVYGSSGGKIFCDMVAFDTTTPTTQTLSGAVLAGVPGTRTYTMSTTNLQLQMSATANTVKVIPMELS